MTSASPTTELPRAAVVPPPTGRNWASIYVPLAFLLPAAFFLIVWVIYPSIYTMYLSLWSDSGQEFVGLDNYQRLFNEDPLLTALKNNALWVLIIPAAVTAVGLVFAVLIERVFWATAFKISLFIPLAVSLFAVGVIWRIMYQKEPDKGAINALIQAVRDPFVESGIVSRAQPSTDDLEGSTSQGFELKTPVRPGDVALLGLTGMPASELPEDAPDAVKPEALQGGITGTVWRDFSPDSDRPGEVEPGEVALAGATVELRDANGKKVESTTTDSDGTYRFENVGDGEFRVAVGKSTFAEPFAGVNWLGESLITPAIMFAYIWVTAGFAMVIIGAGLAAIPRDVLEAARTDGGSEFQIFRRVTVPLLAPVLTVVFVTQIISVLKLFDLIFAIAPGSSQDDAATLSFQMWKYSFSGQNRFGLGAAIATFLLLLFIPFLIINIRRFRAEAAR